MPFRTAAPQGGDRISRRRRRGRPSVACGRCRRRITEKPLAFLPKQWYTFFRTMNGNAFPFREQRAAGWCEAAAGERPLAREWPPGAAGRARYSADEGFPLHRERSRVVPRNAQVITAVSSLQRQGRSGFLLPRVFPALSAAGHHGRLSFCGPASRIGR